MSKRILSLVLALVMVLGTFGTVFAAEPTENAKVDWLVEEGLVLGDAGGLRLADPISRAEVATMVVRALDLEDVAKASAGFASSFTDMNAPGVVWARGHVTVAAGKGIVNGYLNGEFRPANDITYAEVAAMMVRVLGGLTEAEEKTAVWPTTYLAKAVQLGVFQGVEGIADYNAPATREKMFEMVYNAIVNKEFGNYTIVKAIVLENYRVEKLGKDEVVIEVIKEVQRANQLDTAIYERGDQEKLVIEAKVGDVEDLLGKVADFTLDKNGKVVSIKVDESYKTEIVEATASKNKFGSYTVELSERYKANQADERIYRTYYNNKAFAYEDFYSQDKEDRTEFDVEYAKITTKNGKVLFIDAFNFDDIAPVKEVKNDGATVVVYNDLREGTTKNISVGSTAKILFASEGNLSVGAREDIQALDVIHEYNGGFIVRRDAVVEGTYEKVSSNRDREYFVNVEGEAYLINMEESKQPVYVYGEKEFYTLEDRSAAVSLKEFEDEEVTILLDVSGNLQYIGAELEMGEFIALVTKVVGKDVRVLKSDNKTYDYTANLDTKVNGDRTGHQALQAIQAGDLVYMSANGDIIEVIKVVTKYSGSSIIDFNVDALNTRAIDLNDGKAEYRLLSDTLVFVSDSQGNYEVRTIKEVSDAFEKVANRPFDAYVVNGVEADELFDRPVSIRRDVEAFAIVFTNINLPSKTKSEIVEFDGWANARKTIMNVRLADGTLVSRELLTTANVASTLTEKDIIKLTVSDNDDKLVSKVAVVIEYDSNDVYEVVDFTRGLLTVRDSATARTSYYVVSGTAEFGKSLSSATRVKIAKNATYTNELEALLVVSNTWGITANATANTTGVVSYINDQGTALLVDADVTPFAINDTTVLVKRDGTKVIGTSQIFTFDGAGKVNGGFLAVGDQIKTDGNVITIVKSASELSNIVLLQTAKDNAALEVEADYTPATWTDLQDALAMPETTDTQITAKTSAINAAISNLVMAGLSDLNAAKLVVSGSLTEANYVGAKWASITVALAMPEVTNADLVAKTTAISNAVAGLTFVDTAASATFGTVGHTTVTITLNNGEFKNTISASDFTFGGTDAALIAAGTFVRTNDNEVTVTTAALTAADNTVVVKGAAIATETPQGAITVTGASN